MFLKNRNIISKIKRSEVTDYAALRVVVFCKSGNISTEKFYFNSVEIENSMFYIEDLT